MAKTTDTHLSDLDQRITELTQQVRERFQALKQEIDAGQKELEQLSEHHARLTGKALLTTSHGIERGGRSANGSAGGGGSTAGKAPKTTKSGKKRSRKPSPPIEWLQETLSKRGMTVRQLQEAAEADGYSGLRLPEILKGNKQFKSQPGEKQERVKGIPAAVWGVK